MLSSLILFGSRARGDNRTDSDVDLLGVADSGGIEECRANGTSLYVYPLQTLLNKAKQGDLFLLHLLQEGKVLHDADKNFEIIRATFNYKHSYENDIRAASAIIWLLLEHSGSKDCNLLRRRLVWSVRTILIARLAEQRTPSFSSAALAGFANDARIRSTIDERSSAPWEIMKSTAADVANSFGYTHNSLPWPMTENTQLALLCRLGGIAISTAQLLGLAVPAKQEKGEPHGGYI